MKKYISITKTGERAEYAVRNRDFLVGDWVCTAG